MRKIRKKAYRGLRRLISFKRRVVRLNRKRSLQNDHKVKQTRTIMVLRDSKVKLYRSRNSNFTRRTSSRIEA
ncbi:hypothetical protein CJP74_02270 [Psittacicella melopsittaci]|uniref:Uncharacterized protein n=1 Tax=Psittacicella melopsittaci TaxID=2028576 RepID=A0A3A1Y4V2_9GAMM|nr:hypothetical protein [Psittacicella melopsittaci]RIY33273.1 hypothetical protein CJP74_02270 [Psittacicella melopsittaci]